MKLQKRPEYKWPAIEERLDFAGRDERQEGLARITSAAFSPTM